MHHSGCSHSCLVHKHCTACTCHRHCRKCTESGFPAESAIDDVGKHSRQSVGVGYHHAKYHHKVESHHKGHYACGYGGYALYASENHYRHYRAYHYAQYQVRGETGIYSKRGKAHLAYRLGELVGLHQHKAPHQGGCTEENGKRLHAWRDAVGEHVHGSALHHAIGIFALIHYRKRSLEEFCCHSEKSAHPHPENRSRTAHTQGYRHSGNVAHTHSGADCGHQSLE